MSGFVLRGSGEGDSKNCLHEIYNLLLKDELHGEGNGNPLQYSCLEKSMDRGAWHAAVLGVT